MNSIKNESGSGLIIVVQTNKILLLIWQFQLGLDFYLTESELNFNMESQLNSQCDFLASKLNADFMEYIFVNYLIPFIRSLFLQRKREKLFNNDSIVCLLFF